MSKSIKLGQVVLYSKERVDVGKVSLESFVTVDNLLPNKGGIAIAENMPPQGVTLPKYQKENILVGNIRPYLKKIWFANRDGGAAADVLIFDVKPNHCPKFVYYAMVRDDFFGHMMRGKKGTKMPRGDKNQILDFPIPDIEYTTQECIASVLSSLDAKIELNNRINAELETMAKTLYDYWFVQFEFPDKKGKPYKSSGGKMVWNAEIKRDIPEGWEVIKIGTVLAKETATKKILSSEILNNGKIPVIDQSTDFIAGYTNDEDSVINANEPRIVFGDHTRILKFIHFDFARGADGTQVLLSNTQRMPQHLFYHTLLKIDLSNYGYARHFKFLKETNILLPDETSAQLYKETVKSYFDMIKQILFQNQELIHLRDFLLPLLMNGQVKVKR
jgi:type I restriction enzyme S subunit